MSTPRRPRGASSVVRKSAYHHDDLRRALLDATIAHLRTGDVTGLTMQGLARATGVSPGAPYHHFADKTAVIAALAEEGYGLWLDRANRTISAGDTPEEQLLTLGRNWLRFAATHPSHYAVMFLPDIEDRERFASLHATSGDALAMLLAIIGSGIPHAPAELVKARAVVALSTLHGFASLRGAGVLANIPLLPGIMQLEVEAVRQVVAGAFLGRSDETTNEGF